MPNPINALSRRQFGRLSVASAIAAGTAGAGLSFLHPATALATPVLEPLWQPAQPRDRENSPTEKSPAELMTPKTQAAIKKGLNFLLRNQVKSDAIVAVSETEAIAAELPRRRWRGWR